MIMNVGLQRWGMGMDEVGLKGSSRDFSRVRRGQGPATGRAEMPAWLAGWLCSQQLCFFSQCLCWGCRMGSCSVSGGDWHVCSLQLL